MKIMKQNSLNLTHHFFPTTPEMDCDEPHPTSNEKTQPIQWTEQPTGALVAAGSFWSSSMAEGPAQLSPAHQWV